jgi:hypothetical protein
MWVSTLLVYLSKYKTTVHITQAPFNISTEHMWNFVHDYKMTSTFLFSDDKFENKLSSYIQVNILLKKTNFTIFKEL